MYFEYWQDRDTREWYFHIKSRNGKVVAPSEGYKRRTVMLHTMQAINPKFEQRLISK